MTVVPLRRTIKNSDKKEDGMNKLLEGKCAVIAGGGRGIRRAMTLEIAHHGANVVVNDYGTELNRTNPNPTAADEVVSKIT